MAFLHRPLGWMGIEGGQGQDIHAGRGPCIFLSLPLGTDAVECLPSPCLRTRW